MWKIRVSTIALALCTLASTACDTVTVPVQDRLDPQQVLEPLITAMVGVTLPLDMVLDDPAPSEAKVTDPNTNNSSVLAKATIIGTRVYMKCSFLGYAWIRVKWQNGTSKIYPLSCRPPPLEQPMLELRVGMWATITVPEIRTDVRDTPPESNFDSQVVIAIPDNYPGGENRVRVQCWLQGDAWVWVYMGEDQPPRIYLVRCGAPREPVREVVPGGTFVIQVPGGTPRSVAATVPNGIEAAPVVRVAIGTTPPAASLSPTANSAHLAQVLTDGESGSVAGRCITSGSAWVRVETSEGDWRVYPVTCAVHDQGGGG